MITAILMRLMSEFISELSGYIDLYSTLWTNIRIYKINYWITGVLGAVGFCFSLSIWEYVNHSHLYFILIETCVVTLGMFFGAWLLKHTKPLKKWLRKKHKSKIKKETPHGNIQPSVQEKSTDLPQGSSGGNERSH